MVHRLGGECGEDPQYGGVTHLVVSASASRKLIKKRTLSYMCALAKGLWIVDESWVRESESEGGWADEAPYEVLGDSGFGRRSSVVEGAPARARQAIQAGTPLLRGTTTTFCGKFTSGTEMSIHQLKVIAHLLGSTVLEMSLEEAMEEWVRHPMPRDCTGASSSKCALGDNFCLADDGFAIKHILICDTTCKRQLKNNARIQTLYSDDSGLAVVNAKWLRDCTATYTILSPSSRQYRMMSD